VNGDAELLEIVAARHPPGRFAGRLHGRQKERNQHADNGDHHKQLNERKAAPERGLAH
jgi:hypothetical protein